MPPLEAEQIAQLVDRHGAALRALAAQWSDSPEDFVQEAFCRLMQQRKPPNQPAAWLFRVVRNLVHERNRAHQRRRRRESHAAVHESLDNDLERASDARDAAARLADVQAANLGMMLGRLDELVQHPDAPNLYWSLTVLPDPLIDLRDAIDFERQVLVSSFPELQRLDEPRTEEQWVEVARKLGDALMLFDDSFSKRVKELGGREATVMEIVTRARAELPKLVDRMDAMCDAEIAMRYFTARHSGQVPHVPPWSTTEIPHAHHQALLKLPTAGK